MKFIHRLAIRLLKFATRLLKSYNNTEHIARLEAVRDFLHSTLPELNPTWLNKVIIEGQFRINYFELENGELPLFHFVLPEHPLFVYVGGIETASWETAELRGVPRQVWEKEQGRLSLYKENIPLLTTYGEARDPKLFLILWEHSVNHMDLYSRFKELINEQPNS